MYILTLVYDGAESFVTVPENDFVEVARDCLSMGYVIAWITKS